MYIDSLSLAWHTKNAFTHREDRATLESDLSARWGLARRVTPPGVALFLLVAQASLSLENKSDKLMPPRAAQGLGPKGPGYAGRAGGSRWARPRVVRHRFLVLCACAWNPCRRSRWCRNRERCDRRWHRPAWVLRSSGASRPPQTANRR